MSGELERGLLGALALRPALLEDSDLRDHDFPAGRFRETFQAIVTMWEESRPAEVDPVILTERVGGNGAGTFIASLLDGNVRLSPDAFLGRVSELRKRALTDRIRKKLNEQDKASEFDLDEIRGDLEVYDGLQGKAFDPGKVLMPGTALQVLQLEAAWSVEKLVPARSITVLHSPGGMGKSWLCLALAKAISEGLPFLGLPTKRRPVVYVDFENPLPLLVDRARKLDIRDVLFWHLSASPPPPRLDTAAHTLYRRLPAGALVIFDTLRAAHSGDENSSQDMALVMARLKELREFGFDIFLIHHTGKASDRLYKGSTAISDLADHVLKLYRSRRGSLEESQEDDEPDPDATYVLATGKTRFEQFHLHLAFDPNAGTFSLAEDPGMSALDALATYIAGEGCGQKQGDIIAWAKSEGVGPTMRSTFLALLNRGEREGRWHSRRGFKGAKLYEPSTCS